MKFESCKATLVFFDFCCEYPGFQSTCFGYTEWRAIQSELKKWFNDPDCKKLDSQDYFSATYWKNTETDFNLDLDTGFRDSNTLINGIGPQPNQQRMATAVNYLHDGDFMDVDFPIEQQSSIVDGYDPLAHQLSKLTLSEDSRRDSGIVIVDTIKESLKYTQNH